MPALDLIRPSVTAMRVIASVNDGFARELKLPPHIRSLGLITADSDDVTYIAADEATKQAMVEVVYGRSLYAGAAHGPSPTAGEVLIMLGDRTRRKCAPVWMQWSPALKTARRSSGRTMRKIPHSWRMWFRVPARTSRLPQVSRWAIQWPTWWRRRWKRHSALTRR